VEELVEDQHSSWEGEEELVEDHYSSWEEEVEEVCYCIVVGSPSLEVEEALACSGWGFSWEVEVEHYCHAVF
jgi:hypothetical protein